MELANGCILGPRVRAFDGAIKLQGECMSSVPEAREYQFPTSTYEMGKQLAQIENDMKRLERRQKLLKEQIIAKVPIEVDEDGKGSREAEGLKVSTWLAGNPAYAKVITALKERGIIPKTKFDTVEEVKEEFTTKSPRYKIELLDEDEEG